MRVRLESTSCETSLMILALSFGDRVVNHFARRWREECAISTSPRSVRWATTVGRSSRTYNFALPGQQNEIARICQYEVSFAMRDSNRT